MSRKHFNAIAEALKYNKPPTHQHGPDHSLANRQQWESDCKAMADVCRSFNGMFDKNRFLSACGME